MIKKMNLNFIDNNVIVNSDDVIILNRYINFNMDWKELYSRISTIILKDKYNEININDLEYINTNYESEDYPHVYNLTYDVLHILKNYNCVSFSRDFDDINNNFQQLPNNIKWIIFERAYSGLKVFNKPLNNLPPNLIYLELGSDYNQSIDNLPSGLKILRLGDKFNQTINNLPNQLEILEIGKDFNKNLDNLPSGLKVLIFRGYITENYKFNIEINRLPLNLEILILEDLCDSIILDIDFTVLNKLQFISLPKTFNNSRIGLKNGVFNWPPNLKILKFGYYFNSKLDNLSESLEELIVSQNFNLESNLDKLPSNLKNIWINIRRDYIYNDNCNLFIFDKIRKKYPNISLSFLDNNKL
jgi:hypothetical protein